MKRYQALADDIAASIADGLLKPGDRLPSVRQCSATRKLSMATVFEAYYLLEARGLIHSRPRSGYYVSARPQSVPLAPDAASSPDGVARPVAISEIVYSILQSTMSRDVVPLGSAFPSPTLFPLPRLGRALANAATHMDPWSTAADLTPGNADLRRQIAMRYLLDEVRINPDDIVITNGAIEALNLCLAATCKPGDAVVIESPCFYGCLQALERLGLRAVEVATDPREGIDLGALDAAIVRHRPAACWVMGNFQNPLGSTMPAEKKRRLVELVARHGVPLIEDDVYHELYFDARRPTLTKSFDDAGWVLHCSSFSKSLAPGYRIGWVLPGRYGRQVAKQKLAASLATPVPTQLALARYLERGNFDRHLRALRATLQARCEEYSRAIADHFPKGTRISRPAGGYFLWVELPETIDSLALQQKAMAAGVSLAPGPLFSASGGFGNFVRINYGHAFDARAASAVALLGKLAKDAGANAAG